MITAYVSSSSRCVQGLHSSGSPQQSPPTSPGRQLPGTHQIFILRNKNMNFTLDWARSGRSLVLNKAASIGVEIILALFCLEDGPDTVLLQSSWQTLHANNSEYFISLTWSRPTNPTMQHMLNVVITEKIGNLKNMFIFVALCSTNCPKLPMLHALDIIIRFR